MAEAATFGADLLVDRGAVLAGVGLLVGLVAEVLEFYIEVVGAEDVAEAEERGAGFVVAAGVDEVAHLAVAAAGEADQTLGVRTQRLDGDEWRPFPLGVGQMGGGKETAEVGIALAGLGEEHEVVRIVGIVGRRAPGARRRRRQQRLHPHLGPEDGLDAALGAGLGEAHRAVEAVVVGESQGRLPQLGRPGDQFLDPAPAVEEGEVRMYVQVDEGGGRRLRLGRSGVAGGEQDRDRPDPSPNRPWDRCRPAGCSRGWAGCAAPRTRGAGRPASLPVPGGG